MASLTLSPVIDVTSCYYFKVTLLTYVAVCICMLPSVFYLYTFRDSFSSGPQSLLPVNLGAELSGFKDSSAHVSPFHPRRR